MKKKLLPKGQFGFLSKLLRSSSKILPKKVILKTGDFEWSNKETKDFLNRYFASQQISGNDFGLKMNNVTTGLPDHIITHLTENTIERNIRAMRNAGYSES